MRIIKWLFKTLFKIISFFIKKLIKKDFYFSLIDLETTGLYKNDRIVEISIRKVDFQGNEIEHLNTLVNPERDVGPQSIHKISALDVQNAPVFSELVGNILSIIDNSVLVGHNINGFDIKFLSKEFEKAGLNFIYNEENTLDSLRFAKELKYPLKLEKLYKSIVKGSSIKKINFHNASEDTKALLNIFKTNDFKNWVLRQQVTPIFFEDIPEKSQSLATRGEGLESVSSFIESIKYSEKIIDLEFDEFNLNQYSIALQSYIEDKEVSDEEILKLQEFVSEFNISIDEARQIHKHILDTYTDIALLDSKITDEEMYKLRQISKLLGIENYLEESIENSSNNNIKNKLLDKTISVLPLKRESNFYIEDLKGKLVCFTGDILVVSSGQEYDKDGLTSVSKNKGINISSSLNKKVDILVAQDVFSQSSKIQKAKNYGIRILDSNDFARKIGVIPDSL